MLLLFPREYRSQYGEELHAVFNLSLDDALKKGKLAVVYVVLQELVDLPKAILLEHLRQRRRANMVKKFGAYFHFSYGSRREFISALYPFLLIGFVSPVMDLLMQFGLLVPRSSLVNGIGIVLIVLAGILILVVLVGLVTGLPRWSLPYVGFMLALISVYVLGARLNHGTLISLMAFYNRSWFLGQVAYQGSLWVGLTIGSLLLLLLFQFIPLFRRFRNDWTLLIFLLYGATPFALMFAFDDYVHEEPYKFLIFLILISGIWIYLRAENPRRRFWALFGGMTVALFIAAAGKAILGLSQPWFRGDQIDWWGHEMMSTIILWMWIALSMCVPAVIHWLLRFGVNSPAGVTES